MTLKSAAKPATPFGIVLPAFTFTDPNNLPSPAPANSYQVLWWQQPEPATIQQAFAAKLNQTSAAPLDSEPNQDNAGEHLLAMAEFYDNFFAKANLPEPIRRLENTSRYYSYLYGAWEHHRQNQPCLMVRCLSQSWQYSNFDSQHTIADWLGFLSANHAPQPNDGAANLEQIPELQQLIEQTQATPALRISVIIPTYNDAQYLPQAIESVLSQTYQNFEIIVIDDGSTDDTKQQLHNYYPQIRYVYQANQGAGTARNRGLYLARGDLIAFLDADDLFFPHKLQEQLAIFEARPEIGIVNSGFQVIRANGEPIIDVERWREIPQLTPETWLLYKPVLPSAMMFRRHWFDLVGGFEQRFFPCEDMELVLRMVTQGCQSAWLERVVAGYRRYDLSATALNSSSIDNLLTSAEEMQEHFFSDPDLPESLRQLESPSRFYYFSWLAWICYQTSLTDKMSAYLLKSHQYACSSWVETMAQWVETFTNCARTYGCNFEANALIQLPQWRQVISQIASSPLVKHYQNTIAHSQQLLNFDPPKVHRFLYAQTYFQLGQNLRRQHDLERGIIYLRQAIELAPHQGLYHHALGQAFQDQYELQSSHLAYLRAVRLQPSVPELRASLERNQQQLQQWRELLDYCQQPTNINNQHAPSATRKLLMIFPSAPNLQPKDGSAIRIFEQLKYFGPRYQLIIAAFVDQTSEQYQAELEQYCDFALLLEVGTPMSPYQQPLSCWQTWNMWKSLEQLSQLDFDAVWFESIFTTVYHPLFGDRLTILHEQQIESQLLQDRTQSDHRELIRHEVPKTTAPLLEEETAAQSLATYEKQRWPDFSLITVASELERQTIKTRLRDGATPTQILVVSPGINTREISPVDNSAALKILLMGTMSYEPNLDGAIYFVQEILPLIRQQQPQLTFCIAGREPPAQIMALAVETPAVEVIADPDDIRAIAAQCQMSVVPWRIAGTTKTPILHAMAMGLPVIATTLGCQGLKIIDNESLLIRDLPADFANAVLDLATDPQLRTKLSSNGRNLVETHYDWQSIFSNFERSLSFEDS